MTPTGRRLAPPSKARAAPGSTISVPFVSSAPAIQVLRAVAGEEAVRNQVQRAPSTTRRSGFLGRPSAISICVPPAVAILPASIFVRMPPRDRLDAASPAMPSISGVIRRTTGMCLAEGSETGGAV